jgi:flagellar motility protein MotE (MotC chaperone)
MMRFVRDFRLIPFALVGIASLFLLKTTGLLFQGSYILSRPDPADSIITGSTSSPSANASAAGPPPAARQRQSWAQEMFNYPDITGSVAASKPAAPPPGGDKTAAKPKPADPPKKDPGGTVIPVDGRLSPAERAILERLSERREQLEARARELDTRESLIKAAEKRMEARVAELKELEGRITTAVQQKDEAEAKRFKDLVVMYENMKAKDAARILDRLDMKVLLDVTSQINPRRMSDILAQMSSENAERLTTELAGRASAVKTTPPAELPKIEGRPNGM